MKRSVHALPIVTGALVVMIVAVYGLELVGDGQSLCERFGFVAARPSFLSAMLSMWLHDPNGVAHVLGNVAALLVLGAVVEPALGHSRMFALFVASGLGGCAMHLLVAAGSEVALVGASGGIAGLMAVAAVTKPRFFLGFVATFIAINLFALFVQTPLVPSDTSVASHIGGFFVGFVALGFARLRARALEGVPV